MFGAVLDRAKEELEVGAQLRDTGGRPRRDSFESLERLVQPASQVLLEVAGDEHVLLGRIERFSSLGPVEVEGRGFPVEQLGVACESARDELERPLESLLGDRVEAKLAAGEDEGAGPDPVREPLIRALEEERVRRQRRSPREQLLAVDGELEALAGSVFAAADPEQLRWRVEDSERIVGIEQRPPGTRRDDRISLGREVA